MRRPTRRSAILLLSGMMVAAVLFLLLNHTLHATSTPDFCISCHEMEPAYRSWKASSHYRNESGVVAVCADCHLPPPEHAVSFSMAKAYHGTKDVWGHFFGGDYDRKAQQEHVIKTMPNERCMQCHSNLLALQSRGARLGHMAMLYRKPGTREKRCLDCHSSSGHKTQ